MKKILIPLIIVVAIGAIVGALFFFKDTPVGKDGKTIGSFFPVGDSSDPSGNGDTLFPPIDDTNNTNGSTNNTVPVVFLRQLHNKPVAGIAIFEDANSQTKARFMERAVGHIYESGMLGVDKDRISNETRQGIYSALWSTDGDGVAFMQLDGETVTTFTAELTNTGSTSTTMLSGEGSYLPEKITGATSFGNELFYLYPASGGIVGTVSEFNGENKNQVFNSLLTEWLTSWVNANTILLTTKPSAKIPGYTYTLNVGSEQTTKVLGGILGLTANMSPDEKSIIYSEGSVGGFSTFLYDTDMGTVSAFIATTLPEKCVWSSKDGNIVYCAVPNTIPRGEYPDSWYKGITSFSDSIWKIDTEINTIEVLSIPETEAREQIDATKLALSPNEDYLVFINKKDSTPWSLQLVAPVVPKEALLIDDINFENEINLDIPN